MTSPSSPTPDHQIERLRFLHTVAADRSKVIADLALFGLKTGVILSGGAIAGLMALLARGDATAADPAGLAVAVGWFIASLVAILAVSAIAYVGQNALLFYEARTASRYLKLLNGADPGPEVVYELWIGNGMVILALLTALASMAAFAFGACAALNAFAGEI